MIACQHYCELWDGYEKALLGLLMYQLSRGATGQLTRSVEMKVRILLDLSLEREWCLLMIAYVIIY